MQIISTNLPALPLRFNTGAREHTFLKIKRVVNHIKAKEQAYSERVPLWDGDPGELGYRMLVYRLLELVFKVTQVFTRGEIGVGDRGEKVGRCLDWCNRNLGTVEHTNDNFEHEMMVG